MPEAKNTSNAAQPREITLRELFAYDENGNPIARRDPAGWHEARAYDDADRLTHHMNPQGLIRHIKYGPGSQILRETLFEPKALDSARQRTRRSTLQGSAPTAQPVQNALTSVAGLIRRRHAERALAGATILGQTTLFRDTAGRVTSQRKLRQSVSAGKGGGLKAAHAVARNNPNNTVYLDTLYEPDDQPGLQYIQAGGKIQGPMTWRTYDALGRPLTLTVGDQKTTWEYPHVNQVDITQPDGTVTTQFSGTNAATRQPAGKNSPFTKQQLQSYKDQPYTETTHDGVLIQRTITTQAGLPLRTEQQHAAETYTEYDPALRWRKKTAATWVTGAGEQTSLCIIHSRQFAPRSGFLTEEAAESPAKEGGKTKLTRGYPTENQGLFGPRRTLLAGKDFRTVTRFDPNGNQAEWTDPNGTTFAAEHTPAGPVVLHAYHDGAPMHQRYTQYDALGRAVYASDNPRQHYSHDGQLARRESTTQNALSYDTVGQLLTEQQDTSGHPTRMIRYGYRPDGVRTDTHYPATNVPHAGTTAADGTAIADGGLSVNQKPDTQGGIMGVAWSGPDSGASRSLLEKIPYSRRDNLPIAVAMTRLRPALADARTWTANPGDRVPDMQATYVKENYSHYFRFYVRPELQLHLGRTVLHRAGQTRTPEAGQPVSGSRSQKTSHSQLVYRSGGPGQNTYRTRQVTEQLEHDDDRPRTGRRTKDLVTTIRTQNGLGALRSIEMTTDRDSEHSYCVNNTYDLRPDQVRRGVQLAQWGPVSRPPSAGLRLDAAGRTRCEPGLTHARPGLLLGRDAFGRVVTIYSDSTELRGAGRLSLVQSVSLRYDAFDRLVRKDVPRYPVLGSSGRWRGILITMDRGCRGQYLASSITEHIRSAPKKGSLLQDYTVLMPDSNAHRWELAAKTLARLDTDLGECEGRYRHLTIETSRTDEVSGLVLRGLHNVTFRGFTFRGVRLKHCSGITFDGCTFLGTLAIAGKSPGLQIQNCDLRTTDRNQVCIRFDVPRDVSAYVTFNRFECDGAPVQFNWTAWKDEDWFNRDVDVWYEKDHRHHVRLGLYNNLLASKHSAKELTHAEDWCQENQAPGGVPVILRIEGAGNVVRPEYNKITHLPGGWDHYLKAGTGLADVPALFSEHQPVLWDRDGLLRDTKHPTPGPTEIPEEWNQRHALLAHRAVHRYLLDGRQVVQRESVTSSADPADGVVLTPNTITRVVHTFTGGPTVYSDSDGTIDVQTHDRYRRPWFLYRAREGYVPAPGSTDGMQHSGLLKPPSWPEWPYLNYRPFYLRTIEPERVLGRRGVAGRRTVA